MGPAVRHGEPELGSTIKAPAVLPRRGFSFPRQALLPGIAVQAWPMGAQCRKISAAIMIVLTARPATPLDCRWQRSVRWAAPQRDGRRLDQSAARHVSHLSNAMAPAACSRDFSRAEAAKWALAVSTRPYPRSALVTTGISSPPNVAPRWRRRRRPRPGKRQRRGRYRARRNLPSRVLDLVSPAIADRGYLRDDAALRCSGAQSEGWRSPAPKIGAGDAVPTDQKERIRSVPMVKLLLLRPLLNGLTLLSVVS
jgi:hypothetical protein